jgi:hypothetical protein
MIHWAFLIITFIIGAVAAVAVMCLISYGINKVDEYERRQGEDM